MAKSDLKAQAEAFARELNTLLNGTVCNGPRLSSVFLPDLKQAWVGYGISKVTLDVEEAMPVCIRRNPNLYLDASYRLRLDETTGYLMVISSYVGLYLDLAMKKELCHFDFERDKTDGYPEAHLQIHADSDYWSELLARVPEADRPRDVAALHFPVGGRRFRPALEDVIEFLATERFVETRADWHKSVEVSREAFREKQLRAAVWRYPEVVKDELAKVLSTRSSGAAL